MKRMNISKFLRVGGMALATGYFSMFSGLAQAGDIAGSIHDFSDGTYESAGAYTWNTDNELCTVCHTPHASDTLVAEAPLWTHTTTTASFQMYGDGGSTTFDGDTSGGISGVSVLCLSCHDGSVALDSFGGVAGTTFISDAGAGRDIGEEVATVGDLRNDHPVSFVYDTALASADGGLFDPSVKTAITGDPAGRFKNGTIDATMLAGGMVQCTTCHDVHNNYVNVTDTDPNLLRLPLTGSVLCLTCHDK